MNVFSCVPFDPKNDNVRNYAKITNIYNKKQRKPLEDSNIAMCKFYVESSTDALLGTIYACNFDKEYLETKAAKIPMLRILVSKHTTSSSHQIADLSVWFRPSDIKDIKLVMQDTKYNDICLPGSFDIKINTLNEDLSIKNTTVISNTLSSRQSRDEFINDITKNAQLCNILNNEWLTILSSFGL